MVVGRDLRRVAWLEHLPVVALVADLDDRLVDVWVSLRAMRWAAQMGAK